jgi:aminoglycoside 3-N-acetyltransferase I
MHAYYFFVPVAFSVVLGCMKEPIEIFRLQKSDLKLMINLVDVFNEVFEEYHTIASQNQLEKTLSKPSFYAIVAIIKGKIVGGLTAYELERYYNDSSELYIYDIAVKVPYQNQGVGKRLISYLKLHAFQNDIETIFVEAHSDDTDAVKFYESTFGTSEKVDHFNLEIRK